ncbi:hypothetical protein HZB01_01645 [Candidatus Woesearchaeota archaeon]|nr:hypothetical protein [Candidatus Woesearchaeota archaeon]
MGLSEVKEEILAAARKEAAKIVEEGKREVEVILSQEKDKIKVESAKQRDSTEKLVENMRRKEIAQANAEVQKAVMQKKRELINVVFEDAIASFEEPKRRKEMVEKLLKSASSQIAVGTIFCSKNDVSYVKGYPTKESSIRGGIIAENKEGTVALDFSYETIFGAIKENHLAEISHTLFEGK